MSIKQKILAAKYAKEVPFASLASFAPLALYLLIHLNTLRLCVR